MAQKEQIVMAQKELSRYEIIKNLIDGKINGTEASKQISLSVRQIKRLKAKIKKQGPQGIIHGNKNKQSNRKFSDKIIEKVKNFLHKEIHYDFKPTFMSEKLKEIIDIKINKETTRQIMINEKIWKPKPRKKNGEYRSWRPRKEYFGEMEQFDGSYHEWFEKRAPACCLLASIDDATGKITKLEFTFSEGVIPVFIFWKAYFKKHGKPLNIYLDRFSTYKINAKHLFDDPIALTQFERAMKDLNTNVIHAYSPQAKGRVERLFGALQDRLVKELRLANISTIEEANEFLEKEFIPKFNEKFAVVPEENKNLHKELNKIEKENLDKIFSIQDARTVNNDFTISYESKWYQLDEEQKILVYRKDKVLIEKQLDETIKISLRNKYLNFEVLPKRPEKEIKMKIVALSKTKSNWKPPIGHPWRKFIINPQKRHQTSTQVKKIA